MSQKYALSSLPAPLQQSLTVFKGVGSSRANLFAKLDIATVADLLFHFPRSYDDLSDVRPISQLTAGVMQTVHGEVVEIEGKSLPDGRRVTSVVLDDESGACVEGVWFNQTAFLRQVRYGQRLAFSGKPKWAQDHYRINHPRLQELSGGDQITEKILPVYPLTDGVRPDQLRDMIRQAQDLFGHLLPDILPDSIRNKRQWKPVEQALRDVHFPQSLDDGLRAKRRFVYEEFLVLQVALAVRRRELRDQQRASPLPVTKQIDERIRRLLPFTLTGDQIRAVAAICGDMASDRPMQRLLQADVGAGKTAVAVYALLVAIANRHQAALMAPTEVLAKQHWRTLDGYLSQSQVRRVLLTGSLKPKEKRETLDRIKNGEIDLVIGTQALVQDGVEFAKLGLVVIDEQHKFGVHQRARIRRMGVDPHYLVMTATPIPRTMALTVFGDLDSSIIRQMPPGRMPVTTRWIEATQRSRVYEHLRQQLKIGRQCFVVCPLVEESENLDLVAAEQLFQELRGGPFSDCRLGLLHGRRSAEEKDEVMARFRDGEIDLLVTTVVIEVGVDVPNATLMVVEHAERFGLSQLHQLRGRISRGKVSGECYLFTGKVTDEARERLRIFTREVDGFRLAEEDARLRGLGEFFGARQHGLGELHFGDLLADRELLETAREDAFRLVSEDAGLRSPEHAGLRGAVVARYGKTLDLAAIG